jgi:exodeoxyribonuclease V
MMKNHIKKVLLQHFGYDPTPGQDRVMEKLADFVSRPENDQVFILSGYAGTGKTYLVGALVKTLETFNLSTVLLAPTGRAARILSLFAGKKAYTIHKKIYRQQSMQDGFGVFLLDRNLNKNTVFIVDEASMIANDTAEHSSFGSGRLLDDLVEYVCSGNNCRLVLIGDEAQLPPVGLQISPALDPAMLKSYGLVVIHDSLQEIIRQELNSGILFNATRVREMIQKKAEGFPLFRQRGFGDVVRVTGDCLIEELSSSYDKEGIRETIIVTRSNKRANKYNEGIRRSILCREEELSRGDFLMVVKNNYFWLKEKEEADFIANGDTAELVKIYRQEDRYGFRFADVCIRLVDYEDAEIDAKIILDVLNSESAAMSSEDSKKLFFSVLEDYAHITTKRARYKAVREDPWFNALQVKFAYAVTCHKSQGGQWKQVYLDQGYITRENAGIDYLRWMYTAWTRAMQRICLVNFPDQLFEEKNQ